jgi:acyl carrier protein
VSGESAQPAIREILETALDVPLSDGVEATRDKLERWDSLAHLEVVFMLEERFDVRFSEEEIAAMDSETAIIAVLRAKHAA